MKIIRYFSFFFNYSSSVCSLPFSSSPPLAAEIFGCRSSSEFFWDQGCSLLLGVKCRAQILSPSPRHHDHPCCLTKGFYRLAEKINPSKCQSPYILLFVQQSHYPHRSPQLCRASSKGLLWQKKQPRQGRLSQR